MPKANTQTEQRFDETDWLIGEEIKTLLVDGRLPCPMAFKVSRKLNVSPKAVGEKTDQLRLRIIDCQLGCFGLKKATHDDLRGKQIDADIAKEIRNHLTDGHLTCRTAWDIARHVKASRKRVGDTATQMKVMLVDCQLGCF